jgi:hypothetical protein
VTRLHLHVALTLVVVGCLPVAARAQLLPTNPHIPEVANGGPQQPQPFVQPVPAAGDRLLASEALKPPPVVSNKWTGKNPDFDWRPSSEASIPSWLIKFVFSPAFLMGLAHLLDALGKECSRK